MGRRLGSALILMDKIWDPSDRAEAGYGHNRGPPMIETRGPTNDHSFKSSSTNGLKHRRKIIQDHLVRPYTLGILSLRKLIIYPGDIAALLCRCGSARAVNVGGRPPLSVAGGLIQSKTFIKRFPYGNMNRHN